MVMDCRSRWLGLEQEGFGIVFVEAAAAGVAQVAGRSGGSHEAVQQRRDRIRGRRSAQCGSLLARRFGRCSATPSVVATSHATRERCAVDRFDWNILAARLSARDSRPSTTSWVAAKRLS